MCFLTTIGRYICKDTKQFGNRKEISEIFHKNILLIVWNEEFGDYLLLLVKIHHLAKLIEWHSAILEQFGH